MTRPKIAARAETSGARRRAVLACLALAWLSALAVPAARGEEPALTEYQVKAEFLKRFALFITWPAESFENANSPITIGVLGEDPFGPFLEKLVEGQTIQKRKLTVKRSKQVDDLKKCQVVFVSKSEAARVPQILATLGNASILTVGETDGFARRGGVMNFVLDKGTVQFEINLGVAERHGLAVSAQLARFGRKPE